MNEAILTTLIAGGFSVLVALIEVMRRQNNRDHGINAGKLDALTERQRDTTHAIERVETKIDTHINDHARGNV